MKNIYIDDLLLDYVVVNKTKRKKNEYGEYEISIEFKGSTNVMFMDSNMSTIINTKSLDILIINNVGNFSCVKGIAVGLDIMINGDDVYIVDTTDQDKCDIYGISKAICIVAGPGDTDILYKMSTFSPLYSSSGEERERIKERNENE